MTVVFFETYARPRTAGSVVEWARENPLFFRGIYFPPLRVAQAYARKGREDHGMSGLIVWDPFELTPQDYLEIKSAVQALHDSALQFVDPEIDIADEVDWQVWSFKRAYGVPEEEHRKLLIELDDARKHLELALQSKDEAAVSLAQRRYFEIGNSLASFLQSYMRRGT